MMKFLRSQSQVVLSIILGILALSFLFYGNVGNLMPSGARTMTDFGRIHGEDVSVAELYDAIRNVKDLQGLKGSSQQMPPAQIADEAWDQLLLLREADRLHIEVTDQEVVKYIQAMPAFQKDGVYSPELYQSRMSDLQAQRHISSSNFVQLIHNVLRLAVVQDALFSNIHTPLVDVAAQYQKFYGPTQVSVVTFDPQSFVSAAKVTPQEIEAEYKAHPENPANRTPEKRKVDYILFTLTPDQAKLPDKDKTAAIQALGEKAVNFALQFQPEPTAAGNVAGTTLDFMAEAKKQGFAPETTPFFAVDEPPSGVPPSPNFNQAAFSLSKDEPVSQVVQLDNGVALLHLSEIQPSDLRPLAEVTPVIEKQLQEAKGNAAKEEAAKNAATALQAAVAKGTDFASAATALGLKAEVLPKFVPLKVAETDRKLQIIAYTAFELKVGEVSSPAPIQTDNSLVIVHLDSRDTADTAGMAEFEVKYRQSRDSELRNQAYVDWANWESTQPGTRKPPHLADYGGVE